MPTLKDPTSAAEQIEILKQHGCIVADAELATRWLASVGYYRLSAYFLPFKQPSGMFCPNTSGMFCPNTTFENIVLVYEFDRRLRSIIFSAVEEIEIHFRTALSEFHAAKYGALGYTDVQNFAKAHNHNVFMQKIVSAVSGNCKVPFVKHHITHYAGQFPVWVVVQIFTFGMLSYFYYGLTAQDQKSVAKSCFGVNYKTLQSWLHCCTDVRNICAHYDRLYYRVFTTIPAGFNNVPLSAKTRLWGVMLVLKELYPSADKWNSEILSPLETLFKEYACDINLYHLAFPQDWATQLKK